MSLTKPQLAAQFSSASREWSTPQNFFDRVNQRHRFDLDVCATAGNAKCAKFFSPEQDGLQQNWEGVCWMNPPYGRVIAHWIKKAYEASLNGATVVCLLPARTDTAWWHSYCKKGSVEFIRGRLKFGGARHNAPFPCALVTFAPVIPKGKRSRKAPHVQNGLFGADIAA